MAETTVISKKFTVTYKRIGKYTDGEPVDGFLGNDSNSGGYPFFDDEPDYVYLRDNLADAISDANMVESTMKEYYGCEEVDFSTVRVVRYKVVIETIDDIYQAHQEALVSTARTKLTHEELAALTINLKED